MLLVIDIGNTNITLGVFDDVELKTSFRMTSQLARTSDEYGSLLWDLLRLKGIELDEIDTVIIASVVPKIMHSFTSAIIKYLKITPLIVGAGTKTGIKILTPNPKE